MDTKPEVVEKTKKILMNYVEPNLASNAVPFKKTVTALAEHLGGGESQRELERKYNLSNGYLNATLKRIFPSPELMEKVMEEILLANTLVCAAVVNEKAPEMSAKDAAVATGIMAQRYLEVKKARSTNFQGDLPVSVVIKLESTMKRLDEKHGRIIDVEE